MRLGRSRHSLQAASEDQNLQAERSANVLCWHRRSLSFLRGERSSNKSTVRATASEMASRSLLKKWTGRGHQNPSRRRWLPRSCCGNFHQTLRRHSPPLLPQATVILSCQFFVAPVALHDRQKAVSSTGPVHWQDRRFPSCVATPSTNNPDDTAKVLRVRQRQSTTNKEIQKIVETTQRQTSHHRFRSSRKQVPKIAEVPQVVQRQCRSPNDPECREDPTGPILDRITVAPVGIQRQTPTIQSPQQPLASLSVSRLAGSSDTQNVCRMTKSRNRTGSRAWRKSSAYRPPAHAVAAAGADSKDQRFTAQYRPTSR